jgi:hypothetical protein
MEMFSWIDSQGKKAREIWVVGGEEIFAVFARK